MCGRYTLTDVVAIAALIRAIAGDSDDIARRFNICPSQTNPVLKTNEEGKVQPVSMRWGLIPFWEKSAKPKFAPINARSEEMFDKPMFRQSLQKRRCLIPADGFYEWQKLDEKTKQPYFIARKQRRPFFIAGIYEAATTDRPETYALLTTGPNTLMAQLHDRMPVILDLPRSRDWVRSGPVTADEVAAICQSYPAEDMEAFPATALVNSPKNDLPECIERVVRAT